MIDASESPPPSATHHTLFFRRESCLKDFCEQNFAKPGRCDCCIWTFALALLVRFQHQGGVLISLESIRERITSRITFGEFPLQVYEHAFDGIAAAINSALLQPPLYSASSLSVMLSAFRISSFNPTVIGGKPSMPDVAGCCC